MPRALSTVVLLGLLVASAVAFGITEHLKLIKSPIYATEVTTVFSPKCGCRTGQAKIAFKLRRADTVTVTIVDSAGHDVDTVREDAHLPKGVLNHFYWDGRTSAGTVAPDGIYHPEIADAHRTILMPNKIEVDTSAPKVVSASDGDGLLVTGGHDRITVHYVFDGRAQASVYVGGHRVILGRPKLPQGGVNWNGKRAGTSLPPGRYVFEVAAVDKAGNETPRGGRKRVAFRITPIALGKTVIRVAAGARFSIRVRTAAKRYMWTLAGQRGSGKREILHLRAPSSRGRYRLIVSEHGHSTSALLIVRRT